MLDQLWVTFTSSYSLHIHLWLALSILNHVTAQKAPAVAMVPLQGRFPSLQNADSCIGRTLEFRWTLFLGMRCLNAQSSRL